MPTIKIAPSILAADFGRLAEEVQAAEQAGATQIHIDVMDGRFVPNITLGPVVVSAIRQATSLPLDVHLMIVEPERHLAAFAEAGANSLTVHYEGAANLHRTLQAIQQLGLKTGLALNPHTAPQLIAPVLPMLDTVLIMTVNPGFGGQPFLAEMTDKVRQVRAMIEASGRDIDLSVDGGIGPQTVPQVLAAGANVLVAGSALFGVNGGVATGMQTLQAAIARHQQS